MEGRKKRERRKAFRNKKHSRLSEIQLKEMDCEWDLPPMHKLIGRTNGRPLYRSLFTALESGSASELVDEFISPPCNQALSELRVQSVCALNTIARQSSQRFRIARIWRIIGDSIPSVFGKSHSGLVRSRVTSPQMRTFLRKIFTLVFPTELIGAENWGRLIENFMRTLGDMRTRSQLFPYAQTCAGLRCDEIQWLHTAPFALKALVVKHLARFLSRFVVNMLSSHFHVTESSTMRVFIYRTIDVWAKIVGYSLQLFIARGKWQMVARNNYVCTFVLRFIPKGLSVRPVVKFKDSPAVVHRLKQVKAILGYIVATKPWCMAFGMNCRLRVVTVAPTGVTLLVQPMKRGEGTSLYWAAGDVANCFPSIDHSTLERLLCDLLGTKEFITLSCWVISEVKSKSGKEIWRKIYSAGPNRHVAGRLLRLRKREAICSNPSCSQMSEEEVLESIRQYVLHAHLKCKKALYRSNRGIPQGSSLSWILCNLYLGGMERRIFEHRPRGLFCRRYVDDYIVITNNRGSLVEFGQQLVRESDRGFGIRFNWDKMVVSSNLERRGGQLMIALRRKEKLRWCGQAFNTRTMRVTVDYRRYRANPPMLSVPQLHPTEKFGFICSQAKRLVNYRLNSLRLCNDGLLGARWRRQLNRDFLDWAFKTYFRKFVSALGFEMRGPMVRQLMRWVSNRFPTRDFLDVALPSLAL